MRRKLWGDCYKEMANALRFGKLSPQRAEALPGTSAEVLQFNARAS
jgi:hypothetical protein